ncbi:MAG TPA: NfeD family protein [Mycobacteriales bacterium]|nr:NfeD family protein [Mycobacteriales bacterium]
MSPVVWVVVAVALCAGEVLTLDLVLLMLAGGAVAGGATALATDSLPLQAGVAALVALLLLTLVRPLARRHLEVPGALTAGTDRLRGRPAVVVQPVTEDSGQVRIDGELWRARPWSGCPDAAAGSTVVVAAVEGATLHVYPEDLYPEGPP